MLFNWYNLDSNWHHDMNANRILLLEPSVFQQYPISSSSVRFMLELASNIPNLIIYTGEFSEMKLLVDNKSIYFKQHPMQNYVGLEEKRKSMATIPEKELKSFFSYWKYIEPELRQEFNL